MPLRRNDLLELLEVLGGDLFLESAHVEILVLRDPSDRGLQGMGSPLAALDDPLEDAHVVAETGPEELALVALAEPVHVEDARDVFHELLHLEPVRKVVSHVVAAEGEHGHRIAANLTDRPGGRGRHLGPHGRPKVDTVDPVEGLKDEGHRGGPAPAEDHGADAHSLGVFPVGVDDGTVPGGGREAAVRVA